MGWTWPRCLAPIDRLIRSAKCWGGDWSGHWHYHARHRHGADDHGRAPRKPNEWQRYNDRSGFPGGVQQAAGAARTKAG